MFRCAPVFTGTYCELPFFGPPQGNGQPCGGIVTVGEEWETFEKKAVKDEHCIFHFEVSTTICRNSFRLVKVGKSEMESSLWTSSQYFEPPEEIRMFAEKLSSIPSQSFLPSGSSRQECSIRTPKGGGSLQLRMLWRSSGVPSGPRETRHWLQVRKFAQLIRRF